jgi:hypothetical protein
VVYSTLGIMLWYATLQLGKYPLVYSKAGEIFGSLPPSLGDISVAYFAAGVRFRLLISCLWEYSRGLPTVDRTFW